MSKGTHVDASDVFVQISVCRLTGSVCDRQKDRKSGSSGTMPESSRKKWKTSGEVVDESKDDD